MARRVASTRLDDETWRKIFQSENLPQPLERRFSSGAFGTLFVSELPGTGKVAIKQVEQRSAFLNRELRICSMLAAARHPFIVQVKGHWYTEDPEQANVRKLHLMMEFVPQTLRSVLVYLNAHEMRMKASRATEYSFQLARALVFLEAKGIMHRDIKPENVLVDTASHVLKLADFGSAKEVVPGENSTTYICTRYYRAPELLLAREQYDCKVDVWAFGCLMAEMARGTPAFQGEDSASQLVAIMGVRGSLVRGDLLDMAGEEISDQELESIPAAPSRQTKPWSRILSSRIAPNGLRVNTSFGKQFECLLDRCLTWSPKKRIAASHIILHPFYEPLLQAAALSAGQFDRYLLFTDEEADLLGEEQLAKLASYRDAATATNAGDSAGSSQPKDSVLAA